MEDKLPVSKIIALDKPVILSLSANRWRKLGRLISLLTINHLSSMRGKNFLEALKETLRVYSSSTHINRYLEIEALHCNISKQNPLSEESEIKPGVVPLKALKFIYYVRKFHTGGSAFFLASVKAFSRVNNLY